MDSSFNKIGFNKDVKAIREKNTIAWTHRKFGDTDIYFVSNQAGRAQHAELSFRINGKMPEIWDPVTGNIHESIGFETEKGRRTITLSLEANQSVFIVFRKKEKNFMPGGWMVSTRWGKSFSKDWEVSFDKFYGGPTSPVIFAELKSWTLQFDASVKYYSGTGIYRNTFFIDDDEKFQSVILALDSICDIATVKVNGIDCGTLWTRPFESDLTKAVKPGENKIEIEVTNTWHNRLIGDNLLPPEKRVTWTTAPFRLKDKPLLPAGIIGSVKLFLR